MSDEPIADVDDFLMAEGPNDPEFADASKVTKYRPWGPWATIGWSVLLLLVSFVVQMVVFVGFLVGGGDNSLKKMEELSSSALLLSVATLTSTPILIGLIVLLIYFRRCSINEYLALRLPSLKATLLGITGLALLLASSDLMTYGLGRPIVPEVMISIYKTGWLVPLLVTLVVAAPLGEEILFRGFVYEGIASSRWGAGTAIVLSSIVWALIHIQYDWYPVVIIFFMGLYLGEVRRRSGSLWLTILLHAIANIVATAEMMIVVQRRAGL